MANGDIETACKLGSAGTQSKSNSTTLHVPLVGFQIFKLDSRLLLQ